MNALAMTPSLESLVRPAVREMPTYVPAKIEDGAAGRSIKLDMNESPYGPSPKTQAALASFEATNRYPDFAAAELRQALAHYVNAPVAQVGAGAGLDDVLNNLMVLLIDPGDEVVVSEPTFGVYRGLVGLRGGTVINAPISAAPDFVLDPGAVLASVTERTKLVIICNPNNPTGNLFDPAAIEHVVGNAPCLVAIDEAYAEFVGTTSLPLMDRYPNVCVLRTMSKFAGLAGMRVGYGVFPESLMPHLWRVTPAFCNVSAASTAAAVASLDDLTYLRGVIDKIVADRDALARQLRSLPGVEPFPSATNFLLVRLPVANAKGVVSALATRGVHVRYFGNPEHGIMDCLRVSIGRPDENRIFLDELSDVLAAEAPTS
ncbi:MAG TPA: histidinol-phosphate transaminase [Thermomicrobiales bacterium]|nr:histidinol-phosphate transaminase [Thermomicrobiales bacterium]